MHIKDHNDAMKFFRTYDNVASKGKWKEFVDEMEFDSMIQEPRTMAQEPRNMYAEGQLVQNTVDGSRPGYNGEAEITKRAKEYQKATGSETSLNNIKSRVRRNIITEDLIDKYKRRGPYGSGFRGREVTALTNPKFYKTILTELNKVKKQKNKNAFFDHDDVIRTGKWYKNLRTRLGNLNYVDTDLIIKKVLNEEFPGSYYGKNAMRDFRREKVVKAFVNYLDVNGELDGNEKRLPELQKFRGTGKKLYRNINETFQEWANGDFEVEGIDRKKLKVDQIKQIKNWSPQYSSSLSIAKEESMKFLNELNTHNPNLSAKEVRQRFFKRFPDVTDGSFNTRITHLTQLKNSGAYDIGGGETRTYKWIVSDKNRSPWLKELLGLKFQGNYSSFINRGDKLLARGLTEEADRLYAAAEKYFGSNGVFTKYEGQGEHPFSRIFGSGPIGNELKINSLVRGDLNMFKRLNFDEPVIQDLTEYNKSTTTPKRRNEIKTLIEGRKKLMNYLTESPNEKGIVESVKFNYGPEKMTVSANVVDIDKVKNFNVEDYVKRGESYLEAFKTKGASLFEESGQIIRQKLDKKGLHKFLTQAGFNIDKCLSSGGRVGFANTGFVGGIDKCISGVLEEEQKKAMKTKNFGKFRKFGRLAGWMFGMADIPIELALALPYMLQGDKEAAKRATTLGLFGFGKDKREEIKESSPEAYKYIKHVEDTADYVDSWFKNRDLNEEKKLLLEEQANVPEDRKELFSGVLEKQRKDLENQIMDTEETMNQIQVGYEGYDSIYEAAKGKNVLKDYAIQDVIEKTDKGLEMKDYGGTGMNIALGLPWDFGMKEGIAPYKGGKPITNLKQWIGQKGQDYYKQLEHFGYESGKAGEGLFDQYFTTADVKDPRDAYTELQTKYASGLGNLEKQEMLEGLKRKGKFMTRGFKDELEAQGIDWKEAYDTGRAEGGIMNLKKK